MLQKTYNITFIPMWLENAMARSGMNFSDALNEEKLLGIVSKSDVVFYLLANRAFNEIFISEVEQYDLFTMTKTYSTNNEISQLMDIQLDIDSSNQLSKRDRFHRHAFGETVDLKAVQDISYALNATLIDDINIVVTVRVADKKIDEYKTIGSLYDQILRVLNSFYPFHVVAASKLFKNYCRKLSVGIQ